MEVFRNQEIPIRVKPGDSRVGDVRRTLAETLHVPHGRSLAFLSFYFQRLLAESGRSSVRLRFAALRRYSLLGGCSSNGFIGFG